MWPILTWRARTKRFAGGHVVTNSDIQRVMQEEIDDLRAEVTKLRRVYHASRVSVKNPAWAGVCDEDILLEDAIKQYDESN